MWRWLKYIWFSILGMVVLLGLAGIFTQTRLFKNWLRDIVVKKVNENLNGGFYLERIDGNLVSRLEIHGILVTDEEQDTVVFIPKFSVNLTPRRIFYNEIYIDSILVDSPYLKLRQLADSSWNTSHLIKSGEDEATDTAKQVQPLGFLVSLIDLHLKNARVDIAALAPMIPERIKNFNVRLAASYRDSSQQLHLKEFRLVTERPNFEIKEITFSVRRNEREIWLQNFVLRSARNKIDGYGKYLISDPLNSNGKLTTEPLNLTELKVFVPTFRLCCHPKIVINTNFSNDSLVLVLDISEQNQRIFLQAGIPRLSQALFDSTRNSVRYSIDGWIQNLDVAHWLGDTTMAYLVNGDFQLQGKGLTADAAGLKLVANFPGCVLFQRPIALIRLTAEYNKGNMTGTLGILGDFGQVAVNANIRDILEARAYLVQAQARQLNIAKLVLQDTLETDINLDLLARGRGFTPGAARGHVLLSLEPSTVFNNRIDTLFSDLQFIDSTLTIHKLHFASKFARLAIAGNLSLTGENNLRFRIQPGNLMALNRFIHADTVHADGFIAGYISGKSDSLVATVDFMLNDILYNNNSADSIAGSLSALHKTGHYEGSGTVGIGNINIQDFQIKRIDLEAGLTRELVNLFLDVSHQDSIAAHIKAQFVADSLPRIVIPEITLDIKNQHWTGGSQDMQFILDQDAYHVQNFRLTSTVNSANEQQAIHATGTIRTSGAEDLQLHISGLDIGTLAAFFRPPVTLKGSYFIDLNMMGTADNPVIIGTTAIRDGLVNTFRYQSINGRFDYRDQLLNLQLALVPTGADSISIAGHLPVNLSLANSVALIDYNKPMALKIKSNNLPFNIIRATGDLMKDLKGMIFCDLEVWNTLNEPRTGGYLGVKDGAFRIAEFGIDYRDFQLKISLDSTRVWIDTLEVRRDNGFIQASGFVNYDSTLIAGTIKTSQFDLLANRFYLVRHKDYEIQVSGNTRLSGSPETPEFSGKIDVLRSSFFLPALTKKNGTTAGKDDLSIPALVAATRPSKMDTNITLKVTRPATKKTSPDLYQKLRGTIHIAIPKNTWIKSTEMVMEIAGNLDLVKNGPDFEIFGTVRIVRGYYDLLGRRFNILEGSLTFQGGTEFNPEIVLETKYVFRTPAREKKILKLYASGNALAPQLRFTLDDDEITEGDAVSYIVFGKNLDELTYGQKSGVAGTEVTATGTGELALGLAANYISSQLSRTLGNRLNLDYIEIKGEDNWQSATFVVGKYLTHDLFMSYQRGFGESENDIARETITLEYELSRYLFLQLMAGDAKTSGFDVIFKYEY